MKYLLIALLLFANTAHAQINVAQGGTGTTSIPAGQIIFGELNKLRTNSTPNLYWSTSTQELTVSGTQTIKGNLDGSNNSVNLDIISPLGATTFGMRLDGYYTDGITGNGTASSTDSSVSNYFFFQDSTLFPPQVDGKSYWSFATAPRLSGDKYVPNFYGHVSAPFARGTAPAFTGTANIVSSYESQGLWSGGNANNYYGFHWNPVGFLNVQNVCAFCAEDVTGGTSTNYAIKTGLGLVTIGNTATSTFAGKLLIDTNTAIGTFTGTTAGFANAARANSSDYALSQNSSGHTHLNGASIGFHLNGVATEEALLDQSGWNFSTTTQFSNGNVGIGTSSPYAPLSVVGSGGVVADHYAATGTVASIFPYASTTMISSDTSSTTSIFGATLSQCNTTQTLRWNPATGKFTCTNILFPTQGAAGSDTNVQFNNLGSFAGTNGFTFNSSLANVTVGNLVTAASFTATSSVASIFPYASTTSLTASGVINFIGYSASPQIYAGDPQTGIHFDGPGITSFHNGGIQTMLLSSTNKVGIATSAPSSLLSVHGGGLSLYNGGNFFNAGTITSTSSAASTFPYASTTALTVGGTLNSGFIGVATTTPFKQLSVNGDIFAGTVTASSSLKIINPAQTFTSTIAAGAQTANRTFTLPVGAGGTFVTTALAQSITGAKTFGSSAFKILGNSSGTGIATINYSDGAGVNSDFNLPDLGGGSGTLLSDAAEILTSIGFNAQSANFKFTGNGGDIVGVVSPGNGTKIMTATNQLLSFWNATPIVQPVNTTAIDTLLTNTGLRASGGIANFDNTASSTNFIASTPTLNSTFAGKLGVATTTPWRQFSVQGTVALNGLTAFATGDSAVCQRSGGEITVDSGVSSCIVSSRTVKHDIVDIMTNSSTLRILKLDPVSFEYNGTNKKDLGLIAEDVAKIDTRYAQYNGVTGKPQAINWSAITADLIKIIQNVWTKLNNHEDRITKLEKENADLQARILKLEKK